MSTCFLSFPGGASPALDSVTCVSFLLFPRVVYGVTDSVLYWVLSLGWAPDDIITHIVHHLLPALQGRRATSGTGCHAHTHTHTHGSAAGHLRIGAVHFFSPRFEADCMWLTHLMVCDEIWLGLKPVWNQVHPLSWDMLCVC